MGVKVKDVEDGHQKEFFSGPFKIFKNVFHKAPSTAQMTDEEEALKVFRMNPIVLLSRILGVDPLLKWRDPLSWLSVAVLISFAGYSFDVFYYFLFLKKKKKFHHMAYTAINFISVALFATLTFFQTWKSRSLIEKLILVDKKINMIGGDPKEFFNWKVKRFEFAFVLLIIGNILPYVASHKNTTFRIIYCYCRMVRDCQVALFLLSVYHLRIRFKALNKILEDVLSTTQYSDHRFLLRCLDGSHAVLRGCALNMNYHSGIQVLLAMVLTAICDVASFTSKFEQYTDLSGIIPKLLDGWFLFFKAFYIIFLVIVSCDLTEHQANLTASIVHRVGNTFSAEGLEKQVLISSIHLLHDKVRFAALGIIPLNITLLAAVGTLVMDPQNLVALGLSLPPPTGRPPPGPPPPPRDEPPEYSSSII